MPTLRYDPTMGDWISFSTERAHRPRDRRADPRDRVGAAPDWEPSCPFCPGNERATLATLDVDNDAADERRWLVRAFPNKYPALSMDVSAEHPAPAGMFREMPGYGSHEVVVESPAHATTLSAQPVEQVERVLRVLHRRARSLAKEPRLELVQIFKNQGSLAGASIAHPHFQIVATPIVPRQIRLRYQIAADFYNEHGVSVYSELYHSEIDAKTRVVSVNSEFVAFTPFASRMPYETWIVPRRCTPTFDSVDPDTLPALAAALSDVLRRLARGLDEPPFNLVIHSAPRRHADEPDFVWHVEILPRLGTTAGFELSTGMAINSVLPEAAAALLRGA